MGDVEGGTKIQRRQPPPQQMGPQMGQQMGQQMGPQMGQQMSQEQMAMMQQQQMMQQQAAKQQMGQQQMGQQNTQSSFVEYPPSILKNKNIPGLLKMPKNVSFSFQDSTTKNTILVIVLFVILNSRLIWKNIARLPMMGKIEPSIVALGVNSLIAGIAYYIISTKLIK